MLLKRGILSLIVLLAAQPGWAGIDETKLIDLLTPSMSRRCSGLRTGRLLGRRRPGEGLPMVTGMPQVISPCLNMAAHISTRPFILRKAGWPWTRSVQKLIAPAVVIDVRSAVEENADYRLSMRDLETWEARHGPIVQGAVVLMLTGWGKRWPDPIRYLGSSTPSDPKTLHFPGFSKEAADFLVEERHVDGIGIDTPALTMAPPAISSCTRS